MRLPDNTSVFMSEMIAILETLRFLLSKPPISCVIFTDSLSSIQSLESGTQTSAIHQDINYCLYQLWCQGVPVTISWIPSHIGIHGNEVADKLAKEALLHGFVDYPIYKDIEDISKILMNNLIQKWQVQWNSSSKGRFYHRIHRNVSLEVKYSDYNRKKQTVITRLKFGKCLLGDVLHILKLRNDNLCEVCQVKEDVPHFLLDCIRYRDMQVEVNDKLLKAGIIPTIESLLSDQMWYDDIWNYVLNCKKDL